MLIDLSFYCRACGWCRVHCRDTQTFPVVPRHSLVSCISVPDSMERMVQDAFKGPQMPHFANHPFFWDTLYMEINMVIYGYIWVYLGISGSIWIYIYGYIWVYRVIYGYNILYGVYIGYIWG